MSITFRPEGLFGTTVPHPADCDGQDGDCEHYGCFEYIEVGLNVSNSNGWAIQTMLGLEPDYSGEIEAEDLLGRALAALALPEGDGLDIPADPASAALLEALGGSEDHPGATIIDCGRREGYIADRLVWLVGVARQAQTLGVKVTWG